MKSIISILFMASQSVLFAQDGIKEKTSIGKFEINTTTISVISELESELKSKVNMCMSFFDEHKYNKLGGNYILQLERDTVSNNSPIRSSHCESVKVYSIGGYSIANIELKQLVLTFLNDKLVKLSCDATPEFMEAVNIKYGKGELRKTEKEVICEVGRLGDEVKLKETTIFESWGVDDIRATTILRVYYNSKCEKNYTNHFSLTSTKASLEISECEDLKKEEIKRKKEEQKKKSLDGF